MSEIQNVPNYLTGAGDVYWGLVGEAVPDLADLPTGSWTLIGEKGAKDYTETGIVIAHNQEFKEIKTVGSTVTQGMVRTGESLKVTLEVLDMTLEQYSLAMNMNSVTEIAPDVGTAGVKEIDLKRGSTVETMALLLRFNRSPYGTGAFRSQYWIPLVCQTGAQDISFQKSDSSMLKLEFTAMEDRSQPEGKGLGKFVTQNDLPT